MPPSELKRRLTSKDVTFLIAADRQGLIPDPWIETALICQTIANCNGNETKLEDFLLKVREPSKVADFDKVYQQRKQEHLAHGRHW